MAELEANEIIRRAKKMAKSNAKENKMRVDPEIYEYYNVPKANQKKNKPKKNLHVKFADDSKPN